MDTKVREETPVGTGTGRRPRKVVLATLTAAIVIAGAAAWVVGTVDATPEPRGGTTERIISDLEAFSRLKDEGHPSPVVSDDGFAEAFKRLKDEGHRDLRP